jgi:T-complex protein 1 subunit gamma
MRQRMRKPRCCCLDCTLEYKKGENQTNMEITRKEDWATLLKMEEEWIQKTCDHIIALKPDVVITEKGLSDLAAHFLAKAGISAIRHVRKTDNNRIARAGATIVNRPEELRPEDVGTRAGAVRGVQAGRRVLHLHRGLRGAQGVHHHPARRVARRAQRG